jgi:uncharacterized protein YqjF (DUF2071 family)
MYNLVHTVPVRITHTYTYLCVHGINVYICTLHCRYDYSDSSSDGEDFADANDDDSSSAAAASAASKKKRAITADGVSGSSSSAKGVAARQQKAANSAKAARYNTHTLIHSYTNK